MPRQRPLPRPFPRVGPPWLTRALLPGAPLLLPGCAGEQSILDPRGPVAQAIATTWWVMFWAALAVFVLVMTALCYAMFRRPEARLPLPHIPFLIGAGLVLPTLVLAGLLIYGTDVGRRILRSHPNPLLIEVTGHRWWWEVRYPATGDAPEVRTANELRLPAGVPVEITVTSTDVIHSFWIPNLGGKIDMIPGRTNRIRLSASAPGRFRAQCSEFCGAEHARMGFLAIAETPEDFAAWRVRRARAATASDDTGPAAFMAQGCADCHTIQGTEAEGRRGPSLTHLVDRPTLGASAAPNTADNLRAWLANHGRTIKPGNLGPVDQVLDSALVDELARFLESLR